jgi:hypothetical protein
MYCDWPTNMAAPWSREQARVFLNEEGRAYEMWKHMMQAGEEFIASNYRRPGHNTANTGVLF